jgi:hypothetical protein
VGIFGALGHRTRPFGGNDYDVAITHERPSVDCGARVGIVCPSRRCVDRWRQQLSLSRFLSGMMRL